MPGTRSSALTDARLTTLHAWNLHTHTRNLAARIPDWRTTTTPDGTPLLTAEVAGPGAAHALHLFATDQESFHLTGRGPGDLRPVWDVDVPGRTALVWRTGGVWVELWHPDTVTDLPHPVPARPAVSSRPASGRLSRASARLPFSRRRATRTP
ncbi:hypothetical protein ADL27_57260 [Streptomyces sp. NRRL F-6602]|nr:hypothetical protein ADL27_57260 [Streptomyces sp. NRRL F-6602]